MLSQSLPTHKPTDSQLILGLNLKLFWHQSMEQGLDFLPKDIDISWQKS